jgi:MarR family transcriptional regulator, negative regulator of the multidrug operon emrRAB
LVRVGRHPAAYFEDIEHYLDVIRERLPGYPHEHVTLARLINHIQQRQTDLYNSVLKFHQLNYLGYLVLMAIFGSEPQVLTASALRDAISVKSANITRLCDALIKKGLIDRARSTKDRRNVFLRLTGKGQRLIEELQPRLWETLRATFSGLNTSEMRQATALLRQLLAVLEKQTTP